MASPAEIAKSLPETLPEDFVEWDGDGSPSGPPADKGVAEPAPAPVAAPKPAARPRESQVASAPVTDAPRKTAPSTPVTVYGDNKVYQPRLRPVGGEKSPSPASLRPTNGRAAEAHAAPTTHRGNGSATNGASTNGASTNGASTNGHATNGHALRGAAANGAVANGSAPAGRRAASAEVAAPAHISEADEVLFHSFRNSSVEVEEKKPVEKKWIIAGSVAAGCIVLLLAILIPVLHHNSSSAAKQPTAPALTTTEMQLPENDAKPSPNLPAQAATGKPGAAAAAQQPQQPAADSNTAADESASNSVPVQSKMMNDQLSAPKVIPQSAGAANNEDAPPPASFGAGGMQGLGDNNPAGNVFGGQSQLKVKAAPPKIVTVSEGVAVGMLVQKTAPVYPPIAKTAGVSGTVVLEAIISKTGTIENLRVVSGPVMLRKAAEDAVHTWRYRPYKLNNEPTEVETTINVIFSLAG
jgi:TonB family protein